MTFLAWLLLLACAALGVRFTILGAMFSKRGNHIFMIALLLALVTFDIVELIARLTHGH